MLHYRDFRLKLGADADALLAHSAVNATNEFSNVLDTITPKPLVTVELGTFYGATATVLASMTRDWVFTFDVVSHKDEILEIKKAFNYYLDDMFCPIFWEIVYGATPRVEIAKSLKTVNFDFSFVDTIHTYDEVKADFELVKSCGRVLIHDVHMEEVGQFLKDIKGTRVSNALGYWEKS